MTTSFACFYSSQESVVRVGLTMESDSVPEKGKGFIHLQRPREDLAFSQLPICLGTEGS